MQRGCLKPRKRWSETNESKLLENVQVETCIVDIDSHLFWTFTVDQCCGTFVFINYEQYHNWQNQQFVTSLTLWLDLDLDTFPGRVGQVRRHEFVLVARR